MAHKIVCDYCSREIENEAIRIIEGTPTVEHGAVNVEQNNFYGDFCSGKCAINSIEDEKGFDFCRD